MDESSKCDKQKECCCGSTEENSQCCIDNSKEIVISEESWVTGRVSTPIGEIRQVSTKLVGIETKRAHLSLQSRFLEPPCNPGRSVFPNPVLTLGHCSISLPNAI